MKRARSAPIAKTTGTRTYRIGLILLFSLCMIFLATNPSSANVHSPQGALDIAGVLPGKYAALPKIAPQPATAPQPAPSPAAKPADNNILSTNDFLQMMRQAAETNALAEAAQVATEQETKPVAKTTDLNHAINIACMLPRVDSALPVKQAQPQAVVAQNTQKIPAAQANAVQLMKSRNLYWPVDGYIYSAFNATRGRKKHGAIDIVAAKGTPVAAAAAGTVSVVSNNGKGYTGYGKVVVVDHGNGVHTLYSHCNSILVKMGQKVKQGEYIATVGRTGRASTNLLHFEVRLAGKRVDPLLYLPERPDVVKAINWKGGSKKK